MKESILDDKALKKAVRVINKQHIDADFSILERYKLTESDLLKGMICENCNCHQLLRRYGTRICKPSGLASKDAHVQALRDYFYLIGPTITNRQLRDFLNISSASTATGILQSLNLTSRGVNKGREYSLFFDE